MATPSSNALRPRRSATPSQASASSEQTIGQFKRLEHIGKGSFAEVYRGIHIVCDSFLHYLNTPGLPEMHNADMIMYRRNVNQSPSNQSTSLS
jgi:hypothetical protein